MIKTSRSEQISTTVNHYLKRRQYMDVGDIGLKKTRQNVCSVKDMAMSCAVANSGSTGMAVSFSSVSTDAALWDQQYCRVKSFITEASEPFCSELSPLIFPVFVHIFLELVASGQKIAAQRFFAKHHVTFADLEEAKLLLTHLSAISTKDDILSNKSVNEFWEHKYSSTMSDISLQYFLNYLKKEDNLVLLQMLSQHLDISVKGLDSGIGDSNIEDEDGAGSALGITDDNSESNPTDITMESLQRIIQKMNESPPPLPSIHLYSVVNAHLGPSCVTMSPDEELLCAGFEDSHIQIWGLSSGSLSSPPPIFGVNHLRMANDQPDDVAARLTSQETDLDSDGIVLRGHSDSVFSMSFLNDRQFLLSASADKTVRLWDTKTSLNVVCYRGHNYPVVGVDSSPIGFYFASCSFDQTCLLWHSDRNYPLRTFIGHTRTVNCVKFHPNGNYLATGSSDMSIRLWSLQDAESKRVLTEHKGMVTALAFSPNGKYLASAGEDHRIKIWDLATSKVVKDFKGHTETVYSLAFSPCSSILASGGHDHIINIWDVDKITNSSGSNVDGTAILEPLGSYLTKSVSIYYLNFSKRNFLQAAGS